MAFAVLALAAERGASLAVALGALAVLYVAAFFLARWNRRLGAAPSSALLPWLRSCPLWFGYLVFGLTAVLGAFFMYVALRALNDQVGDSPHAVERLAPLAVFLFGCIGLLHLLPRLTFGRKSDE